MAEPQRELIDLILDKLTAPLRIMPAGLTLIENIADPVEAFTRSWRVLLNPVEARPEDLRYVSERYFGMSPGLASFLVDTGTDILTFGGLSMARNGWSMLKRGELTPLGQEVLEQHGLPSNATGITKHYARTWADLGFEKASKAYLDVSETRNRLLYDKNTGWITQLEREAMDFINQHGVETWEKANHRIGLFRYGRNDLIEGGLTEAEQRLNQAYQRIGDAMFDESRVLEKLGKGTTQQNLAAGEIIADITPQTMNYDSQYLSRMLDDAELLNSADPETIARLTSSPAHAMGRLITQLKKTGNLDQMAYTDTMASAFDQARTSFEHLQSPAGKEVFSPYMFRRKFSKEDWAELAEYSVTDPFVVMSAYAHRAARTVALHTPLDPVRAARLSGKAVGNFVDAPGILRGMNQEVRALTPLARSGDQVAASRIAEIDTQVKTLLQSLNPEQRSVATQLKQEAMQRFVGFDPFDPQPLSRNFMSRPEATAFMEYMDDLSGKNSLADSYTTNLLSGYIGGVRRSLANGGEQTLNNIGSTVGYGTVGTDLANSLSRYGGLRGARNLEEGAVKLTSLAAFGARPAAAVMQMTQIPITLYPEVGMGNLIAGSWDAGVKMRQILGRTWELRKSVPAGRNRTTIALKQAIRDVAPELERWGLTSDLRVLNVGEETMWQQGRFSDVANTMMLHFTGTELWNRMSSFYSGRRLVAKKINTQLGRGHSFTEATRRALGVDTTGMMPVEPTGYIKPHMVENTPVGEIMDMYAARITDKTQFTPRAGNRAPLQTSWLKSPLWKQFLSYGVGFRNWIADAAKNVAAADMDNLAGMFNTQLQQGSLKHQALLRWILAANGLNHFTGDVMGIDLGERVAGGVLPLPLSDKAVFSPIPVPPVPNMLIQAAKPLLGGEFDKNQLMELPGIGTTFIPKMLVPGGQALSQAFKTFNHTRGGMYLDSKGRGIEPSSSGKNILKIMGFTTEDSRRDDLKLDQAAAVQRKMTEAKWELARAFATGDKNKAAAVQARVDGDPQLRGWRVQVGPNDVKRAYQMQMQTRLERGIKAIGPNAAAILDGGMTGGNNAGYTATNMGY